MYSSTCLIIGNQRARSRVHGASRTPNSCDTILLLRLLQSQTLSPAVTTGAFLPLLTHWTGPDLQLPSPGLRSLISTRNPARQLTFHRFEISKQGHPRCVSTASPPYKRTLMHSTLAAVHRSVREHLSRDPERIFSQGGLQKDHRSTLRCSLAYPMS